MGYRHALTGIELLRNPPHSRMIPASVGISFELPLQISGVQPRQSRRAGTVAAAVKSVTCEAGIVRPGLGTAKSNRETIFRKAIERGGLARRTSCQQGQGHEMKEVAHHTATDRWPNLFRPVAWTSLLLLIAACQPPPDQRQFVATANAERGKDIIERVGCGSCHTISGIGWPKGKVGPKLDGLADRALIAGRLPNRPDVLAAFVREAPVMVPGSAMPAMPVSKAEARDIVAYLYQQGDG
jgi:cytochrome c2